VHFVTMLCSRIEHTLLTLESIRLYPFEIFLVDRNASISPKPEEEK